MKIYWLGIFLFCLNWASAQCDFYEDITGLSMSGFTAGDNTQEYVLVNASGNIEQINSSPDFSGLTAGDYDLYGINYEGARPSEITIGLTWSGISAITSCFDESTAYNITICDTPVVTPCEFYDDITGLTVSGNTAGDNTQQYVLVNSSGTIEAINSTPDFLGLAAGDYEIYGINYEGSLPSEIAVSQAWSGTSAITSCFDATDAYLTNVCDNVIVDPPDPPITCEFYEDITGLSVSGATGGDNTQEYVLVDYATGDILAINSTPDFLGLAAGDYQIYGINYEGSLPSEIAVSQAWSGTSAITSCFDATDAYLTNVCDNVIVDPPDPPITCEFVNDITGISVSGATAGDNTQEYVLVFIPTDEILTISENPEFFNLTGGDYLVYGINYEGVRPPEIAVGNLWSGTSAISSCFDATEPYITNVCEDVCDSTNLTIEAVGFTTTGSFSQTYILVDADADVILSSNTTGVFDYTLYTAMDNLEIYALNTEDTVLLASVTDGATWSTVLTTIESATCADLLGPRDFTVLAQTAPSCCTTAVRFIRKRSNGN